MTMRTSFKTIGLIFGMLALAAAPAQAVTVTHINVRGTVANLQLRVALPTSTAGCTVDVTLTLGVASSVDRANGTSGTGAFGTLIRTDKCAGGGAGTFETGFINQPLTSGVSLASHSASVNVTIPVTTDVFPGGGTATRSLVVAIQFQDSPGDTIASMSHSLSRSPTIKMVTNGQSVYRVATVTGQVTLDGVSLINASEVSQASLETSSSVGVDIFR